MKLVEDSVRPNSEELQGLPGLPDLFLYLHPEPF